MSDRKQAAPTHEPQEVPGDQEQDLVQLSRDDIAAQLGGQKPSSAQLAMAGRALGLGFTQIAALAAGRSDLRMTRAQYEQLRAKVAQQTSKTLEGDGKQQDGKGSLCGCSGSPSSVPAPKQVPPRPEKNERKITVEGTEIHKGNVDGGVVTLRANAQEDVDLHPDNFTIQYKGPDATNHHWLQFIHREVVGIHADGSAHPVVGNITSSGTRGGSGYKLTQGGTATTKGKPAAENYNTDSNNGSDPFYEAGFAANRTADATTIIDLPSSMQQKVSAAFAAGAKKVVSRAHFNTFLVHTDKVTYQVQVSVLWEFNSDADDPRPTMTTEGGGAATELPGVIRGVFHAQYPDFNFIK